MNQWTRTFLKRMEQELEPYREDVVFLEEEGENPDTLRQLFDVGEDKVAPVVMDMAVFPIEDGAKLLHLYTEIALDIGEAFVPGLIARANELNMQIPLGAFGYFKEERQLYHKYSLLLKEPVNPEILVEQTVGIVDMILNIVGNCYEELYALTGKEVGKDPIA